ncbi:16997_t:CDS:2 [Dentiscutata heterogama]|uniref:16997_t:CDS:1 n=1 Tax=Dentiscutata heterogama TaxID=1316150 RepID=A0ACA9LN45_9GLOM|nr:16997_t:CDS:2 [Dentiscutata heterogama]
MTDPAWNEFIKYPPTTPKGHPVAECIHCNHKLSGQAQRLRAHLDSCQKYLSFLNSNQNEFNLLSGTITQKDPNLPLDPFLSRQLNPIEKQTIDKKIARAFYASSIPHALIENDFVIAALKSLCPTYNPPSRWLLSNNLLINEYKEIKEQIQKIYSKEKFISISTDGWSNQHNESIINYMTLTTHGPIFLKSMATETHSHKAEYIAEGIQKVILEFKENFVVSVVTDNAANMHAAWNILRTKFPSILFYGCAAHSANLIISDIFKKSNSTDDELQWAHNTLEIASKITNYFNSHQVVKAYLHETQKQEMNKTVALVNPVKTRWGTQLAVLEKLLESKSNRQIRILIADEDNWDNISVLAEVLRPIVKCITKFENDSATLSLVYKEMADMKNLKHTITSPIQNSVINIISKRFNYMQTPIMLLAYLLDGRFYPHHHFRPTVHALTQLFQEVTPYINNFVPKSENEIHAGLYREYGELVTLLNTNITLQEAGKNYILVTGGMVIYKNNDKKIGEVEDESIWLSDIEQEVNNEETNFWKSFDKLADQVFYDSE